MKFYLGTHKPHWLRCTKLPLFVSHRTLGALKSLPVALGLWALDSGGFTELSMYGEWRTTEPQYVAAVRRYQNEIGNLEWAAPQDWMCEPGIINGNAKLGWPGTHLSVVEHQTRTVYNYLTLRMMAPDLPFVPVLQGWTNDDYLRHVDQYAKHGIELSALTRVGLGSVCRRQDTAQVEQLIFRLWQSGIRLHGFGFKKLGLPRVHDILASADSLAWSFEARRNPALPGCTHKSCANCMIYAMKWRDSLLSGICGDLFRPLAIGGAQ